MFSCQKGKGVYLNGHKVNASQKTNLLDASITVSRSELKRKEWEPYRNDFKSINPIGSVAYNLALVSSGDYDIFTTIAPKNEWDICAGNCIVNEAGGKLIDLSGKERIYNQENTLIFPGLIAGEISAVEKTFSVLRIP